MERVSAICRSGRWIVGWVLVCLTSTCWAGFNPLPAQRTTGSRPVVHAVHKVRKGESLWRISRRYGISVEALRRANGLANPNLIWVGQRLVVPKRQVMTGVKLAWHSMHDVARKLKVQRRGLLGARKTLRIKVGKYAVVFAQGLRSVAVADPRIADVAILSSFAVAVVGKSAGETSLVLTDTRRIYVYDVSVDPEVTISAEEILGLIGLPRVSVQMVRNAAILSGRVREEKEKMRALEILRLFFPTVIDLVEVVPEAPKEAVKAPVLNAQEIEEAIGLPGVKVRIVGNSIVLEGSVDTAADVSKAEKVASLYAEEVLNLVTVRPYTLEEIQQLLGIPTVKVRQLREYVVVEGEVASEEQLKAVNEIVSLAQKKVVNFVRVAPPPPLEVEKPAPPTPPTPPTPPAPPPDFATQLKQLLASIGIETIEVKGDEKGLILSGWVENTKQKEKAMKVIEMQMPPEAKDKIVDLIEVKVKGVPQVRVDVMVLEVNRDALRKIGVDQPVAVVFGEVQQGQAGGQQQEGSRQAPGGGAPAGLGDTTFARITPIVSTLNLLMQRGVAKLLSAPNTVVVSGKEAKFLVGGQIPIPITGIIPGGGAAGAGAFLAQGVEWRDFGIILTVTPTLEAEGVVALKLKTDVSEPDFARAVTIGNSLIPGMKTRMAETEVQVRAGESLVVGGLISRTDWTIVKKTPFLSSIPVLGQLFTSKQFQRGESELTVLVTPTIVTSTSERGPIPAPVAPPRRD